MSLIKNKALNVNVFSKTVDDYLEKIKLGPTEIARYRWLKYTKNLDRDRRPGTDILMPSSISIPLMSKFWDPGEPVEVEGKETLKDSGYKIAGVIREIDRKTEMPVFRSWIFQPNPYDPYFQIRGNVVAEAEIYEALELSNQNASNPFRDQAEAPTFERVDPVREAQGRSKKRNSLKNCLIAIGNLNYSQAKVMGAAYNISTTLPEDVIKEKLESIAEGDPDKFYKSIDSDDVKTKAIITMAKEAGLIGFNAHKNQWYYLEGNEQIANLERKEGVNELDGFVNYLRFAANGQAILGNFEKLLKLNKK